MGMSACIVQSSCRDSVRQIMTRDFTGCAKRDSDSVCIESVDVKAGAARNVRACDMALKEVVENKPELSVTVTGLKKGDVYFFQVYGNNLAGNGRVEGDNLQLFHAAVTRPSPPSNVTVSAEGSTFVIRWRLPADTGIFGVTYPLETYILERSDNKEFQCIGPNCDCDPCLPSYPQQRLCCTVQYINISLLYIQAEARPDILSHFRMRAVNDVAASFPSDVVSKKSAARPESPTAFTITCQETGGELKWELPYSDNPTQQEANDLITGYELQTSTSEHFHEFESDFISKTPLTFQKSQLVRGFKYWFRLRAWNPVGASEEFTPLQECDFGQSPTVVWVGLPDSSSHTGLSGPSLGGTHVRAIVRNFPSFEDTPVTPVCYAQFGALPEFAVNCSQVGTLSTFDIVSPMTEAKGSSVSVVLGYEVGNEIAWQKSAAFPFTYIPRDPARVSAAVPTHGPSRTGARVVIFISHMPQVHFSEDLFVSLSGFDGSFFQLGGNDVALLASQPDETALTIQTPTDLMSGVYNVSIQNVLTMDIAQFEFLVYNTSTGLIVSLLPGHGSYLGGETVLVEVLGLRDPAMANGCTRAVLFDGKSSQCCTQSTMGLMTTLSCTTPRMDSSKDQATVTVPVIGGLTANTTFVLTGRSVLLSQMVSLAVGQSPLSLEISFGTIGADMTSADEVFPNLIPLGAQVEIVFDVISLGVQVSAADFQIAFSYRNVPDEVLLVSGKKVHFSTTHHLRASVVVDLRRAFPGVVDALFSVPALLPSLQVQRKNAITIHSAGEPQIGMVLPSRLPARGGSYFTMLVSSLDVDASQEIRGALVDSASWRDDLAYISSQDAGETEVELTFSLPTQTQFAAGVAQVVLVLQATDGTPYDCCQFSVELIADPTGPGFVRSVSVTSGSTSGGTVVEIEVENFPVVPMPYSDSQVQVQIRDADGKTDSTLYKWNAAVWRSTVDHTILTITMPEWREGFVPIYLVYDNADSTSPSFVFEYLNEDYPRVIDVTPNILPRETGLQLSLTVTGLGSVSQLSDIDISVDGNMVVATSIETTGSLTHISFNAPPALREGVATVAVANTLSPSSPEAFTLIMYTSLPSGPSHITSVHPSVSPLTGGTLVTVLVENVAPVDDISSLIVRLDDHEGSSPVDVMVVADSIVTSQIGLSLTFETPDFVLYGYSGETNDLHITICTSSDCAGGSIAESTDSSNMIEVQDFDKALVVAQSRMIGSVQGGTTVLLKVLNMMPVSGAEEVQVVYPSGTSVVDEVAVDTISRITTIAFTTLPVDQAGSLMLQVSPKGSTDAVFAPMFSFNFVEHERASASLLFDNVGSQAVVEDQPRIESVSPPSGSESGGYLVGLYVRGFTDVDDKDIRVLFDEIMCLPSKISPGTHDIKLIEVTAPSHDVGMASVSVYGSATSLPQDARVAAASFMYTAETTFTVVGQAQPSRASDTGGTMVALDLKNVPFGSTQDSLRVSIDNTPCQVMGLHASSPFGSVLYFRTPLLSSGGAVRGVVSVHGSGSNVFTSSFDFHVEITTEPRVLSAYPAAASSEGGAYVVVMLSNFRPIHLPNEVMISVQNVRATVEKIVVSTVDRTEIGFIAPPFPCFASVCPVEVEIQSVIDLTSVVSFEFEYSMAAPRIRSVQPTAAAETGGSPVTIDIDYFPRVSTVREVIIRFEELGLEYHPSTIVLSDSSRTVVTFASPPATSPSLLSVRVVPLFDQEKSVKFELELLSVREPVLVSYFPVQGPSSTPFTVNVIIENYPIEIGGLTSNFVLVSGPKPATVTVRNMVAGPLSYNVIAGGGEVNSTVHLAVTMPGLPAGRAGVEVGIDNLRYFIGFEIDVYDSTNPVALTVNPLVGPVTGTSVLVELGSFNLVDPSRIVVLAQGAPCRVTSIDELDFVTSVRFDMPPVTRAGLVSVQIYPNAGAASSVEFTFHIQDLCDYDSFCASRLGMVKDAVQLVGTSGSVGCDVSFCMDSAVQKNPFVLSVENAEGPASGGTVATILLKDFAAEVSADVMISCDGIFVEAPIFEQLPDNIVRILATSPPARRTGRVGCVVSSRKSAHSAVVFDFTYYPVPSGGPRVSLGLDQCYAGEHVTVSAAVSNAAPLVDGQEVLVQQKGVATGATVAVSDWRFTKLIFDVECSPENVTIIWPDVDPVTVALKVEPPRPRVVSFFPDRGPKGRSFSVLIKLAGVAPPITNSSSDIVPSQGVQVTELSPSDEVGDRTATLLIPSTLESGTQEITLEVGVSGQLSFTIEISNPDVPSTRKAAPSVLSSSGGTPMVIWIESLNAVANPNDLSSITAVFGPTKATISRIRTSSQELTVIEVVTPALPAGVVDVSVYRSIDPISTAAEFQVTVSDPEAVFDVNSGSTDGGMIITATLTGLPILDGENADSAFSFAPMFGDRKGRVIELLPSGIEATYLKIEVPASPVTGEVVVRFSSSLYTAVVTGSFTYFRPPEVETIVPLNGPAGGGNVLTVAVAYFPLVSSVVDVDVFFWVERAVVKRLVSDEERTVFEILVPDLSDAGPGGVEVSIVPRSIAGPDERTARTASFTYGVDREAPSVEVLLNGNVAELRVEGFEPVRNIDSVRVHFGNMVGSVREVLVSDEELTIVLVDVPPLPPGVHEGSITNEFDVAFFPFQAFARGADVQVNSGPAVGGTLVTVILHNLPVIFSPSQLEINFGGIVVRPVRAEVSHFSTKIEVLSPPFDGKSFNGLAEVTVSVHMKMHAASFFSFPFVYHMPLEVLGATLNDAGNGMVVLFDADAYHNSTGGLCGEFFDTDAVSQLGAGATCAWNAPRTLVVMFGFGATLLPGDSGNCTGFSPVNADAEIMQYVVFTVLPPANSKPPLGRILGPSEIGPCDVAKLSVDVASSRELHFEWSCADPCSKVKDYLGIQGTSRVEIPASVLDADVRCSIQVIVTDVYGVRRTFYHSLTRATDPVPYLHGQNIDVFSSSEPVTLQLQAGQSRCAKSAFSCPPNQYQVEGGCNACPTNLEDLPASAPAAVSSSCTFGPTLQYLWAYLDPIRGRQPLQTTGPVFIVEGLRPGRYQYMAEAFSFDFPASVSSFVFEVLVRPSDLVVIIEGGNRDFDVASRIVLSAQMAYDPDDEGAALQYAWECISEGRACRGADLSLLTLQNAPELVIESGTLIPGKEYRFMVTVSATDGRTASDSMYLWARGERVSGSVIVREYGRFESPSMGNLVNPNQPLFLLAQAQGNPRVEWNMLDPNLVPVSDEFLPMGTLSRRFEVGENTLIHGLMYEVSLREVLNPGRAVYPVQTNPGPTGGSCSVSPAIGKAMVTLFTIDCSGFDDADGSVVYQFGFDDVLFKPQRDPHLALYLPNLAASFNLNVVVHDKKGATASYSTNSVTVTNPVLDSVVAEEMSIARLSEAARTGGILELEHLIATVSRSTPSSSTTKRMVLALEFAVQQSSITPLEAKTVLQAVRQIVDVFNPTNLDLAALEALGRVLLKIATFDLLGMSQLSASHVRESLHITKVLLTSITALRDAGAELQDPNTFGEALVQLGDTSLKSVLAIDGVFDSENHCDESADTCVAAFGERATLADLTGALVSMPTYPVSVKFPQGFADIEAFESSDPDDLTEVQMVFSNPVAVPGNRRMVSGSIAVTVSLATDAEPANVSGVDDEILLKIPVSTTSVLLDEETDRFFEDWNAQCVYWVGASDPSGLNEGSWSTAGCRTQRVESELDAAGERIFGRGFVTCACTHLSTFAVAFGPAPIALSPSYGDVFVVESGVTLRIPINLTSLTGSPGITLDSVTPEMESFEAAQLVMDSVFSGQLTWTPRSAGDFRIQLTLTSDGVLVRRHVFFVKVLFCEHFMMSGETLGSVAPIYGIAWQALYAINPQIPSPGQIATEPIARTWRCDLDGCQFVGEAGGARIRIGRTLTVGRRESVYSLVETTGASYTQLARHNVRRLESLSSFDPDSGVFDVEHRHNATGGEETYSGESLCVVSTFSDGCFAQPMV